MHFILVLQKILSFQGHIYFLLAMSPLFHRAIAVLIVMSTDDRLTTRGCAEDGVLGTHDRVRTTVVFGSLIKRVVPLSVTVV